MRDYHKKQKIEADIDTILTATPYVPVKSAKVAKHMPTGVAGMGDAAGIIDCKPAPPMDLQCHEMHSPDTQSSTTTTTTGGSSNAGDDVAPPLLSPEEVELIKLIDNADVETVIS